MMKMKDSEIEWIGQIPETWNLKRIQFCLNEINEKNSPVKTDQVLSLVKDKGVMLYEEKGNQGNKAKEDVSLYKVAYPNTLIVNSMNILIGSVGISDYMGCVSPVYYVFKDTEESDLRYVNYIFNTREFQKELRKYANGILEIRLRVSSYDIFKRKIPLPDKTTQGKIADYLDKKCFEIDALHSDIEKQIETLEEYKKSVITEAVTKGLNPNVKMKDSGIEWIGMIPSDWQIKRLGHMAIQPISYGVVKLFDEDETGVKILRCSDVKEGYIKEDDIRTITKELSNIYARTILKKNDIVVNVRGTLGGCAVVPENMERYNIAREVALIRLSDDYNSSFFMYCLLSKSFENFRDCSLSGSVYVGLNMETLSKYMCQIPPKEIQDQIVEYLNEKFEEINCAIIDKREQLETLEEYKNSLIYEYVTGKKEVPGNE